MTLPACRHKVCQSDRAKDSCPPTLSARVEQLVCRGGIERVDDTAAVD